MSHPISPYRLSDQAILSTWEEGCRQSPLERALTALRHAVPDEEKPGLDRWSIGQRDACLLRVYAATFGSRIAGTATCPHCGEKLDVVFDVADICNPYGDSREEFELTIGAPTYHVVFRLPSSADLRGASACESHEAARRALAERCVVAAEREGEPIAVATLPDEIIAAMGEAMAERDPQSDIRLDMTCPACGQGWQVIFDIADFLWSAVAARTRQLIVDVHTLALAYGWREADILAMSATRRQMYLDLVT